MRPVPVPLALVTLLALAPPSAVAEPGVLAGRGFHLGQPARPDRTEALVASALHHGTPDPAGLARALGGAGGYAAAEGLTELLARGGMDTRLPALEAARRVGLRWTPLARMIRRSAREQTGDELLAAIEALGAVGDGRDVPRLLEFGARPDARVRAAAFRALRALTGTPVPPVLARWSWHWRTVQRRSQTDLVAAIQAIEADPGGEDVPRQLEVLRAYGWADLELTHETTYAWLVGPSRDLRRAACWVVAELRLADHADLVERTHRIAFRRALEDEAARALRVLGVAHLEEGAALGVR